MTLHPELIYLLGRNQILPNSPAGRTLLRNLRALLDIIQTLKYCATLRSSIFHKQVDMRSIKEVLI
jgi:hypothetical protein